VHVAHEHLLLNRDVSLEKDIELVVHDIVHVFKCSNAELQSNFALHVPLGHTESDARLSEFNLQLELLIVAVFSRQLREGLLEHERIDGELMRVEAINHELRVHAVLEPILALHRLKETVRHSVTHYKLHVLVLKVVLEEVVVLVSRHQTVVMLRTHIEEKREVKLVVVDLGVGCHSPVQVEIACFVQLWDRHRPGVDLVVQSRTSHAVQVLVDYTGAKEVVGILEDVLAKIEELSVHELCEAALVIEGTVHDVHFEIVHVREEVPVGGRFQL